MITPLAQAALDLAKQGGAVFPLHTVDDGKCSCAARDCERPGKHPRTRRGLHDASRNEAQVKQWWWQWPDANVGLATGVASGVVVLDIDGPKGAESIKALQAKHGKLPKTPTARTGGGGWHLYFRHPGGLVRNSVKRLGDGLDVRGDGGYVVAPPSIHASGEAYRWATKASPEVPTAELPAWLLGMLDVQKPTQGRGKPGAYYRDMMRDGIVNGNRNERLTSLAGYLLYRGVRRDVVLEVLLSVNAARCKPPLPEKQVDTIVWSVSRYHPEKESA